MTGPTGERQNKRDERASDGAAVVPEGFPVHLADSMRIRGREHVEDVGEEARHQQVT